MLPSSSIEYASGVWAEAVMAAAAAPVVLAVEAGAAAARLWGIASPRGESRGSSAAGDTADNVVDFDAAFAAYRSAGGHAVARIIKANIAPLEQPAGVVEAEPCLSFASWPMALFLTPWIAIKH